MSPYSAVGFELMGARVALRKGNPQIGERFRLNEGDGDPAFLGASKIVQLAEAEWFTKVVEDDWFRHFMSDGDALLFQVEGGEFSGEYIAVTARTLGGLVNSIRERGWASVIIHLIRNPTASFDAKSGDSLAIGMSTIERI